MPREAKGSIRHRSGHWYARVSCAAGVRREILLSTCSTEAQATKRLEVLVDLSTRLREAGHPDLVPAFLERAATRDGKALAAVLEAAARVENGSAHMPTVVGTTFQSFAEDWTEGRLHARWPDHVKKKATSSDDRLRLKRYVYPVVGHVPLAEFGLDHGDAVMRSLPSSLSSASRRHVAQAMHRILAIAVYPARVLERNPLPRGFLPSMKSPKAFSSLYPAEDAKLLACTDVPLAHRVLWGFMAREGMRRSEAARLTWSSVDLERGAVTLDENKTDQPRAWALDPGVVRALAVWKELCPKAKPNDVVFPVRMNRLADELREHLALAGVDRPALFERSASRQPIRAHDLRATMITIALANGRSETWVQDRTGHTSSVMVNRYRRAARSYAELGLGELRPLDEAIPELHRRGDSPVEMGQEMGKEAEEPTKKGDPESRNRPIFVVGSRDRGRTGTPFRTTDFESVASAIPPLGRGTPTIAAPAPPCSTLDTPAPRPGRRGSL